MANGGTLSFQLNGLPVVVTMTNSAGATPSATYVGGGAVSFPIITTADFGIVTTTDDQHIVSVLINGIESYGKKLGLVGGSSAILAPGVAVGKGPVLFAPFYDGFNFVGASGTVQTIPDPATYAQVRINRITLTGTPCVFTFPPVAVGKQFRVFLTQDATGTRLVTWPANVKWAASTAPTLTVTAAKTDALNFYCYDGVNWLGNVIAQNF